MFQITYYGNARFMQLIWFSVYYCLDCREGHMKKKVCMWICFKVKSQGWKVKCKKRGCRGRRLFFGQGKVFFTEKIIFYKVWTRVVRVEKSEYMGHFSRFMNTRISSGDVKSFNNVSLIARNSLCFMMELSEANETDVLHLVKEIFQNLTVFLFDFYRINDYSRNEPFTDLTKMIKILNIDQNSELH